MDHSPFSNVFTERRRPSFLTRRRQQRNDPYTEQQEKAPVSQPYPSILGLEYLHILDQNRSSENSRGTIRQPDKSTLNSRKTYRGISHAIDRLRFFPRRAARNNCFSPNGKDLYGAKDGFERLSRPRTACMEGNPSHSRSRVTGWLRRATSTSSRQNRWSGAVPEPISYEYSLRDNLTALPIPELGFEPPRLPHNPASGAAARAAAAAQNEILGSARTMAITSDKRLAEPIVTRDSESGIGIDLRDRWEDSTDAAIPVVRKDPRLILPEELMAQILSYLDAGSLMQTELVSVGWRSSASSHHIWREVFRSEYQSASRISPGQSANFHVGGPGYGKKIPHQDWKKMWKARKALHQRWADGHAAAIYLEGHTDTVYCVQFDEDKILTGSRDRTIRIWDAHTYKCIKVLGVPNRSQPVEVPPVPRVPGRGRTPFAFIVSPKSTPPNFSPFDSQPTTEIVVRPLFFHTGSILCLQYDNDIVVTGSSDSTCIVWDIKADYRPILRLRHHTAGVLDVCFDNKYIVSCSKDTAICLWDRQTGTLLRTLKGHRGPVNAVQLRGDLVVSASGDGVAKLWNLTSGLCIKVFQSKDRGMACVEFSPDSRTILAGGNDQVIYQFDANTGELVREMKGHKGLVRSLHLDSANGRIISGSYDHSVKAYDMETGNMIIDFPGWTTSWMLSAKADYRRIVATSQDSRAVIMDFGYQLPGVDLLET